MADTCGQPGDAAAAAEASDTEGASPMDAFAWGSIVLGGPLDVSSEFERRLSAGAAIACRLRGAIRDQLGEVPDQALDKAGTHSMHRRCSNILLDKLLCLSQEPWWPAESCMLVSNLDM